MKTTTLLGMFVAIGVAASPAAAQMQNTMSPTMQRDTTMHHDTMMRHDTTMHHRMTMHRHMSMHGHMSRAQMMRWCHSMSHRRMMMHGECRMMMRHHHTMHRM